MYRIQKKKRRGFLFYLILFVSAFSVGLGIGYATIRMNANNLQSELTQQEELFPSATPPANQPASLNVTLPEETPDPKPMYFVTAQNGAVAVFTFDEQGDMRFSYKLAIDIESLPLIDQKLIEDGIYLYSKQELFELTEDFSS